MTLPLEGIRVLDLSRLLPGPYCTMLMADFGAEVIKIEDPTQGDYARWMGQGAFFSSLNRNKKSVSLNLKTDEGKEIFRQMAQRADMVVESFRPGVMERLGLGYETLKETHPRLIYCSITGYGQDGPYRDRAGHDINFLSYAGILGLNGEKDAKPVVPPVQIADLGGGALMALSGILMALIARQATGKGQFVDISMLDGAVSWLQATLPQYLLTGKLPERGEPELSGGLACYGVYETTDRRYLSVGALEPKFWVEFCRKIGREDLIDDGYAQPEKQAELKEIIASVIKEKTLSDWMEIFDGADACVSPVLTLEEMVKDPQVRHRQMILDLKIPERGDVRLPGIPVKLSETPGSVRFLSPGLGEHNEKYLKELGYKEKEIIQFKEKNVIGHFDHSEKER